MKTCTKCKVEKEVELFAKNKRKPDGINGTCKECINKYNIEWTKLNPKYFKNYYSENKEKKILYSKTYSSEHKDKIKEYSLKNKEKRKQYYKDKHIQTYNPKIRKEKYVSVRKTPLQSIEEKKLRRREYNRRWLKKYYAMHPERKIEQLFRQRLWRILKGKKSGFKMETIIGCTYEYLKIHIEKQFKVGMNWKNHTNTGWHLDHKIPLNSADTEQDLIKLFHYTNLQPLWSSDNIKKGKKIIF